MAEDPQQELLRLRRFVEFVNLWCYRDSAVTEAERLSVIKYHPTARQDALDRGWIKKLGDER